MVRLFHHAYHLEHARGEPALAEVPGATDPAQLLALGIDDRCDCCEGIDHRCDCCTDYRAAVESGLLLGLNRCAELGVGLVKVCVSMRRVRDILD